MSRIVQDSLKVPIGVAVCVGVGTALGAIYYYCKKSKANFPSKWREVGELAEIYCFPVKSCAPVRCDLLHCSEIGIYEGSMRDRSFMVTRADNGEFVTARTYPKLLKIVPKFSGDVMVVSAPGMPDIKINIKDIHSNKKVKSEVWKNPVFGVDAGDEAAQWFSQYMLDKPTGMRLLYYPYNKPAKRPKNKPFLRTEENDLGIFHDDSSYMLMSQSSLDDLNSRLSEPVPALQFRGNFVVRGTKPFDEDTWQWVRIGDIVFKATILCARCSLTTINPETAERNVKEEPLKTLKTYRMIENYPDGPCLGLYMGLRVPGIVKVGDKVYINED